MQRKLLALAVAASLTFEASPAAASATPKVFYDRVAEAEAAVAANDPARASDLYEAAYDSLPQNERATESGTDVVVESVLLRKTLADRPEMLDAAAKLLVRHIDAVRQMDPTRGVDDLETHLAEARALMAVGTDATWFIANVDGSGTGGPYTTAQIADLYARGAINYRTQAVHDGSSWQRIGILFHGLDTWNARVDGADVGPMTAAALLRHLRLVARAREGVLVRLNKGTTWIPLAEAVGLNDSASVRAREAAARESSQSGSDERDRPQSGTGLIVAGSALSGVGCLLAITGAILSGSKSAASRDRPTSTTLLSFGGVNIAVGLPLLAGGLVRRRKYLEFMDQHDLAMVLHPTGTRGVGFSLTFRR